MPRDPWTEEISARGRPAGPLHADGPSSAHAKIVESEPVIHVLTPEAGEDLHGRVGPGVEGDGDLLVIRRGAEGFLSDNVDTSRVADAQVANVGREIILHPTSKGVAGVRLHRDDLRGCVPVAGGVTN